MSSNSYLNMVRVYLTQEFPELGDTISLVDDSIRISPIDVLNFNEEYAKLHSLIEASVKRIRNREYDLNFTIWTPNQTRDFRIYK